MDARRLAYLEAMGIDAYARRGAVTPPPPVVSSPAERSPVVAQSPGARSPVTAQRVVEQAPATGAHPAGALSWEALTAAVPGCTRCGLCEARTQTVFGAGAGQARWMIIGEAPTAEDDRLGEVFSGRAGELLTSMLKACGLAREDVYLANVLKCRPPDNRDPTPAEVAECLPYLMNQITLVNPALILCVGRVAAQYLLGTAEPLSKLRGQVHTLGPGAWPLVVTYHPAYLLRSPSDKRAAWEDLQYAMAQVPPVVA